MIGYRANKLVQGGLTTTLFYYGRPAEQLIITKDDYRKVKQREKSIFLRIIQKINKGEI